MKKRIFSLMMAAFMLLSVFMTSCSSSSATTDTVDEDDEIIEQETLTTRDPETIVLTLMTDDETTDEAIQAVQEEINRITRQRFKTNVVLRYFKESEYNQKLDELIAQIAVDESAKMDEDESQKAAEEESKRIAAIDRLMDKDRPDKKDEGVVKLFNQEFIARETEEVTTAEVVETEQNILNMSVQKYPDAESSQLDVFLIRGTENLSKYVNDEKYATDGESFLLPMDEWLTLGSKQLYQYINPTVMLGGKVGNSTYAIPTNRQIASEYKYIVLDKELVEKYGIDESKIQTLTDAETVKFLQEVKKNETDVAPMLSRVDDAPGIVGLFSGEESVFGAYISNNAVVGAQTNPNCLFELWQYREHYMYMEQYERNGYFAENPTEDTRYGLAVMTGDESFPETMDESKYIVKILEKPIATSETTGEYMLGISKYSAAPDRAMEIITFLNTNAEFRNLLQYGIENENYKIDEDTGKLIRLNNTYMMDIYATGNAFIAYPEEDMELDVWEKAKQTNMSTVVSPYLGFIFENEENAKTVEAVKELSASMLKRVEEFDPEARRTDEITAYNNVITRAQNKVTAAQTALAASEALYAPYKARATALSDAITAAQTVLSDANKAHADFASKISSAESKMNAKQTEINAANAVEAPDQEQIAKLQAEYDTLKAAYDAAVAEGQPTADAVAAAKKSVEDATAAQKTFMAQEIAGQTHSHDDGKTTHAMTVDCVKKDIDDYTSEIANEKKIISNAQKGIEKRQYTTTDEYDKVIRDVYTEFFKRLTAELEGGNVTDIVTDETDGKTYIEEKKAVTANTDYLAFMSAEEEGGVIYQYTEWHASMYGA